MIDPASVISQGWFFFVVHDRRCAFIFFEFFDLTTYVGIVSLPSQKREASNTPLAIKTSTSASIALHLHLACMHACQAHKRNGIST
jgi:hypothetical protein